LGIGVVSRFPLTEARAHSITVDKETAPRPVLEVHLEPWGKPLVFFICHWKSKLGGDDATESLRRASARVIQRRLVELQTEKPQVPVIIMGDLNENHDEFYRSNGSSVTALRLDAREAAELAGTSGTQGDFLILSKEKPPNAGYFDSSIPVLYTPWENELADGSYYYRNSWETIDHFLLSDGLFDNNGWDFDTCLVLNQPPFTNASGTPNSYNPRTGYGLSDHLPLMLYLKEATPDL
jgi:endonuclease/exonuclease/phosphatase family metal-dependent hydrolase